MTTSCGTIVIIETTTMEVPPIAIQWLAHSAQSDVDLARLSNVSREWRRQVGLAVVSNNSTSSLLLPSMVRFSNQVSGSQQDTFCAAWFAPKGIHVMAVTAKPLDQHDNDSRSAAAAAAAAHDGGGKNRYCCLEWRGYRHASEVLCPFGYAESFIASLLLGAAAAAADTTTDGDYRQTSIAVRGATLARPEGYCECWDDKEDNEEVDDDDDEAAAAASYYKSSQVIRNQRRNLLQRQLLPRLIRSSYFKNMLHPSLKGRQQRAVQFLNASGSNAVRLLTPPFSCGPLSNQITILCVGVATEDGCFLSGIKRRCEFGHMYPQCDRDGLIDMSPVCITTDGVLEQQEDDEDDDSSGGAAESSSALEGCNCPFNPTTELFDTDAEDDDDLKPPNFVHKGKRGPGQWHCYVAVIDGSESTIRIDGAQESMTHFCRDDAEGGRVLLDGLTIGSDHSFDMSLCFGEGSPGEGQGSISELVVFQGRLPLADLEALEHHLMNKHGISASSMPGTSHLMEQEDEWRRDSRALIEQSAPYDMIVVPEGVPLRVVARDPSVAWHRINDVTGERIQVGRIGSRLSNGSSDW